MRTSKKKSSKLPFWARQRHSLQRRFLSGVLVVVPIVLTVLLLGFLYKITAGLLAPLIARVLGHLPGYLVAVVSVAVFISLLYLIGFIATVVVGRKLIGLAEAVIRRIPLVKTIYGASKQVVEAMSFKDAETNFRSAIFVDFPHPGMRSLAFVTGTIEIEGQGEHFKVFVPTTPNPTSGYFEIVPKERAYSCGLSVEEAVKFVVSAGLLAPDQVDMASLTGNTRNNGEHGNA